MSVHRLSLSLLLLLVSGCASPPSRFYTLNAISSPGGAVTPISVVIDRVSIPAAVDRPEIVVSNGPNQVALQEFDRWAAPLDDEIARVVAENLSALLGTARVTWSSQAGGRDADWQIGIEVQRFDSAPGVAAALTAVWTARHRADGHTLGGRTEARVPVTGAGYDALAAAHSQALGQLSADIAEALLGPRPVAAQPR